MTTLMWIIVGLGAWLGFVVFILSVLTAAKRSDEALESAMAAERKRPAWQAQGQAMPMDVSPTVVHATDELFGRLAADVRGALGVERVAVVLHDQGKLDNAVVQASCGRPDLVGSRVPGGGGFGWGAGRDSSFLLERADSGRPWSVVSVPIMAGDDVAGTVAVATRRPRGLSARDVELLERLSRRASAHRGPPAARDGGKLSLQHRPPA
jgi:hypothetical protein